MQYKSTRDPSLRLNASQAIAQGISPEGGLFVPESLPDLRKGLSTMKGLSYQALAKKIFSYFLTDFSEEEIANCTETAYAPGKFGGSCPVRLVPLVSDGENKYLLELWHGPTCAFKDMALQILPRFLMAAMKKAAPGKSAVILTATSGDTGKAALEGFKDISGVKIMVLYPQHGVSSMQKRQMVTQEGENVSVCAIEGNFDDAQTAVKSIITDSAMKQALTDRDMIFSSANSINWGRLLPQIVYYFWAYFELCRTGAVRPGDEINVAVPTGNFGNILAAYYAGCMGLPVKKYICASNANKVLTDFISTGVYDRRREFYATSSPSMDILVSSNLERLLYALSGGNSSMLSGWMEELAEVGVYDVGGKVREKVQNLFYGGFCQDSDTSQTIRDTWNREGYLCDPHTAVGVYVYRQYVKETGDSSTPTVIASTASPYKFTGSVLAALGILAPKDEFEAVKLLESVSHIRAPEQLLSLRDKPVRFTDTISKDGASAYVLRTLGTGGR